MLIYTRDLGVVEATPGQLLDFVGPILGFEGCRQYALLPAPDAAPFHWLQSVEQRDLAFPVVNARELSVPYRADSEMRRRLSAGAQGAMQFWVIIAVPAEDVPIRVNLRAPVVVNPVRRLAAQFIMRESYPVSCTIESCRQLMLAATA